MMLPEEASSGHNLRPLLYVFLLLTTGIRSLVHGEYLETVEMSNVSLIELIRTEARPRGETLSVR